MRFGWAIVYVPDVAEAVGFYERAFGLSRRFVHESGAFAEMETGETRLAFAADATAGELVPGGFRRNSLDDLPAGIEIALVTDDVAAAYDRAVAAGSVAVAPPARKPWGQTVSYVRDLNGVLVEIATEVG